MTEQTTARCAIVGLLAVMLGSCAWQVTPKPHALSELTDTAARDSEQCQSSGAALGSQAYKQCRALLEDKMSVERDVPADATINGVSIDVAARSIREVMLNLTASEVAEICRVHAEELGLAAAVYTVQAQASMRIAETIKRPDFDSEPAPSRA
jgi:hypothetical protein